MGGCIGKKKRNFWETPEGRELQIKMAMANSSCLQPKPLEKQNDEKQRDEMKVENEKPKDDGENKLEVEEEKPKEVLFQINDLFFNDSNNIIISRNSYLKMRRKKIGKRKIIEGRLEHGKLLMNGVLEIETDAEFEFEYIKSNDGKLKIFFKL